MRVFAALITLLAVLTSALIPASAQTDDAQSILTLVDAMAEAVRTQDRDMYLEMVDLADPIFASEHTYWIDDWATGDPLDRFTLEAAEVQVDGDAATAELTMRWALEAQTSFRRATFPARFVRGDDGAWRFVGGDWQTLETDYFLVHYGPGLEAAAKELIQSLPEIYEHATQSLDHQPASQMHIKLYDSEDTLGALIALRLPPIAGWNEPGESLKMLVQPGQPPSQAVLAHELTHFLNFDMAGTNDGAYPWWLLEGVAEYVSSPYWVEGRAEFTIDAIRDGFNSGQLAEWGQMSDFEETPYELWRYVYPQGFAFTSYVTEVYGTELRNDWLWLMADGVEIEDATTEAFGFDFATLEEGFGTWLNQPA